MNKKCILICENCLARNYHYKVNIYKVNRLELNKYCPKCNAKTLHKESK